MSRLDGEGQERPVPDDGLLPAVSRPDAVPPAEAIGRPQPPPPPAGGVDWRMAGVGPADDWPPRRVPPPLPGPLSHDVPSSLPSSPPPGEGSGLSTAAPEGVRPPPFTPAGPEVAAYGEQWRTTPPAWPPPPPRRGVGLLAVALLVSVIAAIIGAGFGAAIAQKSRRDAASHFTFPPPSVGGATANARDAAVAAKVDPAVVDVNTTLGFNSGAAAGTGMVITPSGEVLTNNHVVDGATSVTVQINGSGPTYTAKVLGTDATDDVALLQIQGVSNLKTVKLGDSTGVAVGDEIVAIGNALGLQGPPSVSGGAVTALDQSITASDAGGANSEQLSGLIQIDAPLRPGDSGGPLVNMAAEVIGMDTAAAGIQRSRSASTLAFAIPINAAMTVIHQIEAGRGSATVHIGDAAFLGVQIQSTSGSGGSAPAVAGAVVAAVTPNTPAEDAGLAVGDTIVAVDGKAIDSPADLTQRISDHHPGDSAKISWMDPSGKTHSATVRLATGPTK